MPVCAPSVIAVKAGRFTVEIKPGFDTRDLEQVERVARFPEHVFTDMGYRKHDYGGPIKVHVDRKQLGSISKSLWKWMKRRAAVEPTIDHLKQDCRLERNRLKGKIDDLINVILSAASMNFRKLLRFAAVFFASCRNIAIWTNVTIVLLTFTSPWTSFSGTTILTLLNKKKKRWNMDYQEYLATMNEIHFWELEYAKRNMILTIGTDYDRFQETCNSIKDYSYAVECNNIVHYTFYALMLQFVFGNENYLHIKELFDKIINFAKKNDYHLDGGDIMNVTDIGIMQYLLIEDSPFGISYIDEIGFEDCFRLLLISLDYGYFPDTLFDPPDALRIFKTIRDTQATPIASPAFYDIRDSYSHLFKNFIYNELENVEFDPLSCDPCLLGNIKQFFDKKNDDYILKHIKGAKKETDRYKILNYLRKIFIDSQQKQLSYSEKEDLILTYRKLKKITYKSNTTLPRAAGLYLWDYKYLNYLKSEHKDIKAAAKYLCEQYKGDIDSKDLLIKLFYTEECITHNACLPISTKSQKKESDTGDYHLELFGIPLQRFHDSQQHSHLKDDRCTQRIKSASKGSESAD